MNELTSLLNSKPIFIFDFDGVLVDSIEIKSEAFASMFEEYGPDVVRMVVAHHRDAGGISRYKKLRHYHAEYLGHDLTEEELHRRADEFSRIVVDKVVHASEIPGAEHYLRTMCHDKRCFINSATPDKELLEIVQRRGWSGLFDGVYGSSRGKEVNLYHIFEEHKATSDMCVFFGDADSDYLAAREAGVLFVGVNMPDAAMRKLPEKLVYSIHSFKELNC
jgi:phosphoglycolate phosphatase-like HAD superfamily hydrolase